MAVLPALMFAALLLQLPAWIYARVNRRASPWGLLFTVPAVAIWTLLAASGVGAQSRGNLVEVIYLVLGAVACFYLKVFVIDRWSRHRKINALIMLGTTVAAAVLLRLLTPGLQP